MNIYKKILMVVFAIFFVVAGVNHFVNTPFYLSIVPPYIPWPDAMVAISGVAEVLLGIALLVPFLRREAAWGMIALLIAVFPANIHMAMHTDLYPTVPPIALWLRLPLQGVFILWAWWYTRRSDRMYAPFRR